MARQDMSRGPSAMPGKMQTLRSQLEPAVSDYLRVGYGNWWKMPSV
jgi:hypothetical protein